MWCLPHLKASLGSRFSFLDGFLTISPKKQAATMYSMYAYSTGLQNCKIYSRPLRSQRILTISKPRFRTRTPQDLQSTLFLSESYWIGTKTQPPGFLPMSMSMSRDDQQSHPIHSPMRGREDTSHDKRNPLSLIQLCKSTCLGSTVSNQGQHHHHHPKLFNRKNTRNTGLLAA